MHRSFCVFVLIFHFFVSPGYADQIDSFQLAEALYTEGYDLSVQSRDANWKSSCLEDESPERNDLLKLRDEYSERSVQKLKSAKLKYIEAAQEFERKQNFLRAAEAYAKGEEYFEAGKYYELAGNSLEALKYYRRVHAYSEAARIYHGLGESRLAAHLYRLAKKR